MINAEGPPVPIPNTEVKLCRAENTQLATAREDRYTPTQSGKPQRFPVLHISFTFSLYLGDLRTAQPAGADDTATEQSSEVDRLKND